MSGEYCSTFQMCLFDMYSVFTSILLLSSRAEELLMDESWTKPLDSLFESLTIEFLLGNPAALGEVS